MRHSILEEIFELITENKKFPNYPAERRIDIFINYFLSRILTAFLKEETKYICPEFPLKLPDNNQSKKIDYLCQTKTAVIFVELKTDLSSLKDTQVDIYNKSEWRTCVSDLQKIKSATKKTYLTKYEKLIAKIEEMEFIEDQPMIRVVYLSPLDELKQEPFKQIKIKDTKKVADLNIVITEEEKIVWEFIRSLDLNIFEIIKQN